MAHGHTLLVVAVLHAQTRRCSLVAIVLHYALPDLLNLILKLSNLYLRVGKISLDAV